MNRWGNDCSNVNLDIDLWINYIDYPILHDHDYWEFFVVLEGSYKHVINGQTMIVYKNSGYFIRPTDYHAIYNNENNSSHLNVMIKDKYIQPMFNLFSKNTCNLIKQHSLLPFRLNDSQTAKLIDYSTMLKSNDSLMIDKDLIGHLLLSYVLEKVISQNDYTDNGRPKWLSNILFQISSPANMAWDVSDVIACCGYSHSHFVRVFKQYMGCSLISFLTKTKMSNAHDLLVHSDLSMSDIALALGYNSLSRFNHVFKNYFNMSPGQYKKKYRFKK